MQKMFIHFKRLYINKNIVEWQMKSNVMIMAQAKLPLKQKGDLHWICDLTTMKSQQPLPH